jgi:hypothetical protein
MKYLRKITEELKASTYKSAADKLSNMGHKRRSAELKDYSDYVSRKEEEEKIEKRLQFVRKFPPFHLKWFRDGQKTNQVPLFEGLFYIEPSFDSQYFNDHVSDYKNDLCELWISFDFACTPADEDTIKRWKEIEGGIRLDSYYNMYWPNKLSCELIPTGHANIVSNGKCYMENIDSDYFVFSNRQEAIKFKKLLIESLEGKNNWGNNLYSEGLYASLQIYFDKFKTSPFKKDDLPKLINTIKTGLSLNNLFRN